MLSTAGKFSCRTRNLQPFAAVTGIVALSPARAETFVPTINPDASSNGNNAHQLPREPNVFMIPSSRMPPVATA
jgi:hypothetical protein